MAIEIEWAAISEVVRVRREEMNVEVWSDGDTRCLPRVDASYNATSHL